MNNDLDLATVLLLHKSSFLVGALCFLYARWQPRGGEGLGILAAGFLCLALASTLAGLGERNLVAPVVRTFGSFMLGTTGYTLFWIGMRRLSSRQRRSADWLALAVPAILMAVAIATQFPLVKVVRGSTFNATAGVFLALSALSILTDRHGEPLMSRFMLAASLGTGALLSVIAIVALLARDMVPISASYAFFLLIIGHFAVALFTIILVKERAEAELIRAADTDMLTGIGNRRWFMSSLPQTMRANDALAIMDLDHFKQINDRFGHEAGDRVLTAFTRIVSGKLRRGDRFARIGGEEFGLYLPQTGIAEAMKVAERLREAVSALSMETRGAPLSVTVSMGVASSTGNERSWDEVMNLADTALYTAKTGGRNRVVMYDRLIRVWRPEDAVAPV